MSHFKVVILYFNFFVFDDDTILTKNFIYSRMKSADRNIGGAPGQICTDGLADTNPVLYLSELRGHEIGRVAALGF